MKTLKSSFSRVIIPLILILIITAITFASQNVDSTFNTYPSKDITDSSGNTLGKMIVLSNGKLLIYGSFETVNGLGVGKLVRINNDGTIDNLFNCVECNNITDMRVVVQSDGKILVAGRDLTTSTGFTIKSRLIRVNADGSLDETFSSTLMEASPSVYYRTEVLSQQPDGKIFIAHHTSHQLSETTLYRLNTDGSIDNNFQTSSISTTSGRVFQFYVTPMPNGKLYFHGTTPFGPITRLNSDGTEDITFVKPSFTGPTFLGPSVSRVIIQTGGKIVISGNFLKINGLDKLSFARLNSDGSVDLKFAGDVDYAVGINNEYTDGKLLVSKRTNIAGFYFPEKLTVDGNFDTTFNFPTNLISVRYASLDTTTNKIYIFGRFNENGKIIFKFARLNIDGSLDSSFNNSIADIGNINGLVIQSDQKIVMVGNFDRINGTSQATIARVNTDGTLDGTFDGGDGFVGDTKDLVINDDGKIYVYGKFSSFDGNIQARIVRLNANGSYDSSFTPTVNSDIETLALESDGRVLIGGSFNEVNGQNVKSIARLNTDGSIDSSFNPVFGNVSALNKIIVQNDGKVLVGGTFNGVGGFNRNNLAKLNANGSYDSSFNPTIETVKDLIETPNGDYFAMTNKVIKLDSNGVVDTSFSSPTFTNIGSNSSSNILEFKVLSDESIIVNGEYNRIDGFIHRGITRLFSDGSWANLSYPDGANGNVLDIELQDEGKLIVGGGFTVIENVYRTGVARLNVPTLTQTVDYDFDGDGKADVAVFRPSENKWYVLRSSDFGVTQQIFAINGDSPTPCDYDGDGTTDYSIFRNSQGDWWSLSTVSGNQIFAHLGQNGDIPRPSDFDGDGRADYVVYRPSNFAWYRVSSSNGQASNTFFGTTGDKPVIGDFDGDGKSDVAIYRPSTGTWWWQSSLNNGQFATQWGISTDIPSSGDYDGDNITDFAIYRPSTGVWWIYNSSTQNATIIQFGISEDKPVPADYDGDGKVDIAVYRPSTGVWYLLRSTEGFAAIQFGISTDVPIPNALIP